MKKIIITSFILCLSLSAFAQARPYIALRGGYEHSKNKLGDATMDDLGTSNMVAIPGGYLFRDDALTGSVAVGISMDSLRAEIAYSYKRIEDGIGTINFLYGDYEPVKQHTVLANIFYYPFNFQTIKPFAGIGVGLGIVDAWDFDTKSNFAYAFYLGADYTITKHLVIEIMANSNTILEPWNNSGDVHNLGGSLGLRYNF